MVGSEVNEVSALASFDIFGMQRSMNQEVYGVQIDSRRGMLAEMRASKSSGLSNGTVIRTSKWYMGNT